MQEDLKDSHEDDKKEDTNNKGGKKEKEISAISWGIHDNNFQAHHPHGGPSDESIGREEEGEDVAGIVLTKEKYGIVDQGTVDIFQNVGPASEEGGTEFDNMNVRLARLEIVMGN